jgi:aldehyde dehydrogenase (NAD+)
MAPRETFPKSNMSFAAAIQRHRDFFNSGATRPPAFRRAQLTAFSQALERHEAALLAALQADLRKSPQQAWTTELGLVQAEIRGALKHLDHWAAPQRRRTPWFVAPARGWVQAEPRGVALILGPWNFPVQLLLRPLASALAAGNCVVLKPSELAPRTAEAIAALARDTFAPELVSVATGGPEAAEALLAERFDTIFFTGSTAVGRLVAAAAARHLTPVTLELGGKCPAIVCGDADAALAARRIAWGKFMNAGQTCVAPDFVLVQRSVAGPFVAALKQSLRDFYGDDPSRSADYGRIVNARHFARLVNYLGDGRMVHGGTHHAEDLYLAPTLLADVRPDAPVMREEIFGPILPVLEFDRLEQALAALRGRPTPLALYAFTGNRDTEARILAEVRSGGVCINDVISHMIGLALPFGGAGESGLGSYHGRAGFDAFSQPRAVMRRATWLDTPFRYPPPRISLAGVRRAMRLLLRD